MLSVVYLIECPTLKPTLLCKYEYSLVSDEVMIKR
ncbi:MAG: hypothetical protein ACJAYV_002134, partial [Oleispira sp.]